MRSKRSVFRNQGFTLMEVILAMTIISIVVTMLTGIFVTNADIFRFIISSSDDIGELRLAAGRMTLELRSIKDKKSVKKATESKINFINSEGSNMKIEYSAKSETIKLNGKQLAGEIGDFHLKYYDSSGSELSNPKTKPETNIWSVEIEIGRSGQNNLRIISRAYPRNFI